MKSNIVNLPNEESKPILIIHFCYSIGDALTCGNIKTTSQQFFKCPLLNNHGSGSFVGLVMLQAMWSLMSKSRLHEVVNVYNFSIIKP